MKYFIAFAAFALSPIIAKADASLLAEIKRLELSAEIAQMVGRDQAYRFGTTALAKKGISSDELMKHPRFRRGLGNVDQQNEKRIKRIIEQHGWPKLSEYNEFTVHNVWLLVQHMDQDPAFQTTILARMKELLPAGEALKVDYAYLYDRVQANTGKLQLYGTQGRCEGRTWEPKPIEDPGTVDKRRKEMGLPPMEEYRKMFSDSCF